MNIAYIILGSNLGDKKQHFLDAKNAILSNCGVILKESSIYETAAWGKTNQPNFINQVIMVNTKLMANDLLLALLAIEAEMGRVRQELYDARIIDLDLLFFNNEMIDNEQLTIPHPQIPFRRFVLVPLVEIVPNKIHPMLKLSMKNLLQNCIDQLEVRPLI